MGLFSGLKKKMQDDWCGTCKTQMPQIGEQTYLLPMTVGHYSDHKDAAYYLQNLRPVRSRTDIPTGMYGCTARAYQCPSCGYRFETLIIFLPVRDMDKLETAHVFKNRELDALPGLLPGQVQR